jgi:hypothetical protein
MSIETCTKFLITLYGLNLFLDPVPKFMKAKPGDWAPLRGQTDVNLQPAWLVYHFNSVTDPDNT